MRFSLGVVSSLVMATKALPRAPSTFGHQTRRNATPAELVDFFADLAEAEASIPDIPDEPTNGAVLDTCEDINSKTKESWEDSEVGDWFTIMAGKQEKYTQDIQKTVQTWARGADIYGYHCDLKESCSRSFPVNKCKNNGINAAVYFILWSTSYFNEWLTSLIDAVDITSGIATAKGPKIVDTFSSAPDTLPLNTSPGVIAAGVLGAIGAVITGPFGAAAVGIGSSVSTIAVGAMGLMNYNQEIELEPKFNDLVEIGDYIGSFSEGMIRGLTDYGNKVLSDVPVNDPDNDIYYASDPQSLPQILKDGTFAESQSVDSLDDRIYASLFSGVITHIWKDERAFVIKIFSNEPTLDDPPCETDDFFTDRIWCDDDGNAFVLLKHPAKDHHPSEPMSSDVQDDFKDLKGADHLEKYGVNIEMVAKSSSLASSLNGGKPYYEWKPERAIEHLTDYPDDLSTFSSFNLPYCELEANSASTGEWMDDWPRIEDDDCGPECQILFRLTNCAYEWGVGDEFGEMITWENSCDFAPFVPCIADGIA